MNNTYVFGDIKIITTARINTSGEFDTIQCCPQDVNLTFGNPKVLYIPGKGAWTHTVLIWFGKVLPAFNNFVNSLHKSTKIYANEEVSLWLLKSDNHYGTIEVSSYISAQGNLRIKNNFGNEDLNRLDRMYNAYRSSGNIDEAIKILLNIGKQVNIAGDSPEDIKARQFIYTRFTEPFTIAPEIESQRYENLLNMAYEVPRKQHIREIINKIYTRCCELEKNKGH